MKIYRILLTSLVFILTINQHLKAAENNQIIATIKPLHSLIEGVLGDDSQAKLLVDGEFSPHNFQLKPSQIAALNQADLIFYIDDSFETFLDKAFTVLPANLIKIEISQIPGLTILEHRQSNLWQAGEYELHQSDDQHEHHHHHHGHEHGQDDMHLWLDPKNAELIINYLSQKLASIYPQKQALYEANAKQMIAQLKQLDQALKTILNPVKDKAFMVIHDAYQYFERYYGLNGAGSLSLEPDITPTIKQISQIRQQMVAAEIVCVFNEPQFSDRLIDSIVNDIAVKKASLDPLGHRFPQGPDQYFSLLKGLANNLSDCLK